MSLGPPISGTAAGLLALTLVTACGARQKRTVGEAHMDQVFARIQVHEANLARADAHHRRSPDCQATCQEWATMQVSAERICRLAEGVADADARARCAAAQRAAQGAAARPHHAACTCPDSPERRTR